MHPFSLNEEEIKQVSGGVTISGGYTTVLSSETGGVVVSHNSGEDGITPFPGGDILTTEAIGEEGGVQPDTGAV